MAIRKLPVWLAFAFATPCLLMAPGCSRISAADAVPTLRTVEIQPVALGSVDEPIHAIGILQPRSEACLSFKVGGVIESVSVDEGSRVRRGQVLARLNSAEVDAQVLQASETAAKATRDLTRARALFHDGVETQEHLEDFATLQATSAAALSAAIFNARYARIDAPEDGIVLRKLAQAHEVVAPGLPVLCVGEVGGGWIVRGALADRTVVRIAVGALARVTVDAYPDRVFAGRVRSLGSSADPRTGTFGVEVQLASADSAFAEGMAAKMQLLSSVTRSMRPVIPVEALQEANSDEATVLIFDRATSRVHQRIVHVGEMGAGGIVVLSGLRTGEQIVTKGVAFVGDGDRVHAVEAGAAY